MAQYGSACRGCTTYGLQRSDDWSSRTSYDPDHVCRPVLIDAEGRMRPIIAYSSYQTKENCVTKPEGVVPQLVNEDLATEYEQGHQRTPDSREGYGAVDDRQRKSSTTGDNDTPQKVKDFVPTEQTEWYLRSKVVPPRPTRPGYDRLQQADNLVTAKAQLGPGRPGYNLQQQVDGLVPRVPTEAGLGVWRPSPSTWASRSSGNTGYSQYPEPAYKETIDSTEAARRYGNYKYTARPFES